MVHEPRLDRPHHDEGQGHDLPAQEHQGAAGGITVGPDGALWFTNEFGNYSITFTNGNSIGRITTKGKFTIYRHKSIDRPTGITTGPDGALWFTNFGSDSIGRITTQGKGSVYRNDGIQLPRAITVGPDGALWFINSGNSIGRITTKGKFTIYQHPSIYGARGITVGPDGALWFTNSSGDSIGRIRILKAR